MTRKEADAVILAYAPTDGFFDLSEQPETLSRLEWAKVLNVQNVLVSENSKRKEIQSTDPIRWDRLKELSGELQMIVFQHWGDKVFV